MPLLAPPPKFHVDKADGTPALAWQVFTYLAGTSTPKATYQDFGLGAANTNPIVLDARGEATIFLNGSYKFVLKDDVGATIWTVDDIRDLSTDQTFTNVTLAGTLTVSGSAVTWSGNPTHSGNHTFTGNVTVNGNTQLGNASTDTLRIDPNAVTWTNNPTHSGNHTFSGSVTAASVAISTGAIAPGAPFTPTASATTNCTVTPNTAGSRYSRIGDMLHVWGVMAVDPVAASTLTSFSLSLPVASNFTSGVELSGAAIGGNTGVQNYSATVTAEVTNDVAFFSFFCGTDVTSRTWTYHYDYVLV